MIKRYEKHIIVLIFVMLLVNFPIAGIFDHHFIADHIPTIYLYFYVIWGGLIWVYYRFYNKNS